MQEYNEKTNMSGTGDVHMSSSGEGQANGFGQSYAYSDATYARESYTLSPRSDEDYFASHGTGQSAVDSSTPHHIHSSAHSYIHSSDHFYTHSIGNEYAQDLDEDYDNHYVQQKHSHADEPYKNMSARKTVLVIGFIFTLLSFISVVVAEIMLLCGIKVGTDQSDIHVALNSLGVALSFVGVIFAVAGANTKKSMARLSFLLGIVAFILGVVFLILSLAFSIFPNFS